MLRRNLRLKTWLLLGIALLVIVAGTLVGAVRLLDRTVPGYRAQTADWVSERLGQPLEIGAMELTWSWTGPVLQLRDVVLLEAEGTHTVLELRELGLHFAFWDLLRGIQRPDGLVLAGVEIALHRDEDGTWILRGLGERKDTEQVEPADIDRWLDRVHRIRLEEGRLRVTDAAHPSVDMDITGIAGTLRNNGPRHRAKVEARLPADIGGHTELDVFVLGRLERIDDLQAHVYARFENLAGANLLRVAGLGDNRLRGGSGRLEIWGDWRRGRFDGARSTLELGALRLAGDDGDSMLQPPITVDASLEPNAGDDEYHLQLDALHTAREGALETTGTLVLRPDAGRIEGRLLDLPANLASAWVKLAVPGRLAGAGAGGTVEELRVRYAGRDDWRLGGAFTALSLRDADSGLDAGRFDGSWSVDKDGGELHITGGKGAIAVDRYLRDRLPLSAINGRIAWRNATTGRRVTIRDLRVTAAGTGIAGGGELRLPADGPAAADLSFEVTSDDIPVALSYLPQAEDLPNPRLRDWLPKAIRAGRLVSGTVRLSGPLDRFPMMGEAGEFRITAEAEGVMLAYKPDWPALTEVAVSLVIAGDDLDIRASRARILGIPVGPGRAHVDNVREPVLKVDGEVTGGDAQRMLGFLAESPLAERFGRLPEVLTLDGTADLSLALSIPLKRELEEKLAVAGIVHLESLHAAHPALPKPLTDMNGDLRFDLQGLYADGLQATLAGLPLTVSLAPDGENALEIGVETTLRLPENAPALTAFKVPDNVTRAGSGESRWRIGFQISGGGQISDLVLSSDLAGLDLDLPAPLGKSAEVETAMRMTLAAGRKRLRLDYGDRLDLDLIFENDALWGATAVFGGANVSSSTSPPEGPGWWLGGRLDQFDTDAWRRFLDLGDKPEDSPQLRGADLDIGELRIAGQRLREIDLSIVPLLTDEGWRARIDGKDGHGTVFWLQYPDRDRIQVRLERLRLTPAPRTGARRKNGPIDPASLPLLDIVADSLALAGRDFGRLELRTVAVENGLALEKLAVSGGVMELRAGGEWRRTDGLTEANLEGGLDGTGIAPLLQTLGYTANIGADKAKIDARLHVAPNPDGLTPATMDGNLSLALQNGRLLAVEPGAGRVLGLVNFYALPRRLLLDFRDVLGKGTAFDQLKGNFRIEDGNAYTDNLAIRTPSAEIRIKGRVGLAARDYDQRVTITPQVSSAATIAGTVLGGPAVGAAVWVAQQVLGKPLGEMTRVSYHLVGSWDDPQIEEPTTGE